MAGLRRALAGAAATLAAALCAPPIRLVAAGSAGVCWEGLDAARDFAALEGKRFAHVDWNRSTATAFKLDGDLGFYFGSPPADQADEWYLEHIDLKIPDGATAVDIQYSG